MLIKKPRNNYIKLILLFIIFERGFENNLTKIEMFILIIFENFRNDYFYILSQIIRFNQH